MVPRWRQAYALSLICFSVAIGARAQSLSLEEKPEKPVSPPEAPTPAPTPPAPPTSPPPAIVMPEAVSTPLEYPDGARGEATVALELTLSASGDVTHAIAIDGEEPFVSAPGG